MIHPRIVLTIFLKDLIDAIRDARVLIAVIVPVGLGLFYNVTFSDNDPGRPDITVAYFAAEPSALPDALREVIAPSGTLTIREQPDEAEVRRVVADDGADVGLIVPAGFDAAIQGGQRPSVKLIEPEGMGLDGQIFAQALNPALRALAGQEQPAVVETESLGSAFQDTLAIFNQVGFRRYSVLATMLFVIVMVSMLALPVILAEESEKQTLDALLLVASRSDIVIGKAMVGVVYSVVGVGLLMSVTRLVPERPAAFIAVLLLLMFTLIGFGLFMGTVFRSATQINNWSGFLLLPVFAPVFAVGFPVPDVVDLGLRLFPTSQSMRMALNALQGQTLFEGQRLGVAVVVTWGAAAYALVFWQLQRQQR